MESEQPVIVPLATAAERLDISTEAVRKRIQRGTLPGQKIEGAWFVEASALPKEIPSRRPDAASGRLDDINNQAASHPDGDQESVRTASDVAAAIAPLAELIADLTRKNEELSAAASVWQYRALRAEERVEALESGPIAAKVEDIDADYVSQESNPAPLRDDATAMAPEPMKPASDALAIDLRRWWRRITGGG